MNGSRVLGAILLVAGTSIGGGMLALPVSTGAAGFFPALLLFLVTWAVMTYSALLVLEVDLWVEEEGNMVSMARHTLGIPGAAVTWGIYLFLLYSLITAYLAGSTEMFVDVFEVLSGASEVPYWTGILPVLGIFGVCVYRGTHTVDVANRWLMTGMAVAYGSLVFMTAPDVEPSRLLYSDWNRLPAGLSVVVLSCGFAIIIPTLRRYLHGDVKRLRWVIVAGCAAPLLVYTVWEAVSLGVLPLHGEMGLIRGHEEGINGARLMARMGSLLSNPWIPFAARCLTFFAITTSFLGVSLCLMDFLADGLGIRKTSLGRTLLYLLTFGPPLLISFTIRRAFLSALEYAGAFGVITLLALLPALMVWRGRYHLHLPADEYRVAGGKPALLAVIGFSFLVIVSHLWLSNLA